MKGCTPSSDPKQNEKDMKEQNTFGTVRELAKVMRAEAQRVATMYGSRLPVSDWAAEQKTITEIMRDNKRYGNEYPYIIAFRAMGCEGGTRHEVAERCVACIPPAGSDYAPCFYGSLHHFAMVAAARGSEYKNERTALWCDVDVKIKYNDIMSRYE